MTRRGISNSAGTARAECLEALPRGAVRDAVLTDAQAVEEKRLDGQLAAQRLHVQLTAEAPHGDLKGMRPAFGVEGDGFAIEDQGVLRKSAYRRDDLRHGGRHIVQAAGVEAHVVADLVDLDARAVHLPFKLNFARQLDQGLADVGRRLRQHGRDRREQLELEFLECRDSLHQGGAGDGAEALRIHRRAANLCDGNLGGRGDRIDHDTGQRALAQLADQETQHEVVLRGSRSREQVT